MQRAMPMIRRLAAATDGATAPVAALALLVLVGIAALAYDLGRAYNLQSELQNAVDAAALAGASQLDNESGARARAIDAAAGSLVQNDQTFATDEQGPLVQVDGRAVTENVDVTFWEDKAKTVEATDDASANFIEITLQPREVAVAFGALLVDFDALEPRARAMAGMGAAYCKVPPLFFCMPSGCSDPDTCLDEGQGIWMKGKPKGSSGEWFPGNFGILGLNNPDGSTSLSASLIRDAMGRVDPFAECFGKDGDVQTKPGETTTIAEGLNVRFDIYGGSSKDLTDDPQYKPAENTVKGLTWGGSKCSYHETNTQGWHKPADPYTGPAWTGTDPMGFPRDNCAYPTSEGGTGTCIPDSTSGAAGRFGDGAWDTANYVRINHPSMSELSFTTQADLDGDGNVTRYEAYKWELANEMPAEPGATPQCQPNPGPNDPDRRVITMAALDCSDLSGTEVAKPVGFYDVFLTEPMGVYDGNNDLYGEFVGPANDPNASKEVARFILELVE
jgi:Flp pilus assembly protein TadG